MPSNRFVTIDVETANSWLGSICQIGVVEFEGCQVVDEWSTLVNPGDYFDPINVGIHGIDEEDVEGSPVFSEVWEALSERLSGRLVTCYGHFDFSAISQACEQHGLEMPPDTNWLNLHRIVRRVWPERYASSGYGLASVCSDLQISLSNHHDALSDAKAAGHIYLRALEIAGLDHAGMLKLAHQRPCKSAEEHPEANQDGPLYGERIAFTGALTIPRSQAAALAAKAGCEIQDGVTKKTSILVVGDQDIRKLNGVQKSSKHLKAEKLIQSGSQIRILGESDFKRIVDLG